MTQNRNDPADPDPAADARRLLEGLYRQQQELGEIADTLVRMLTSAGVNIPTVTTPSKPRD